MDALSGLYVRAKLVTGVALPLVVLSVALVRVDPVLLAGALLALGTVFGVTFAYARYVDFDVDGRAMGAERAERESRTAADGER